MNFSVPMHRRSYVKVGRPRGSSPKAQHSILLALEKSPKSGKEIVKATMLHRATVWKNLKILTLLKAVTKQKKGKETIYENTGEAFARWFVYLLLNRNLAAWKRLRKTRKFFSSEVRKMGGPLEKLIELREGYAPRIIESRKFIPNFGNTDIWESLQLARELDFIKRARAHEDRLYLASSPSYKELHSAKENYLATCIWFEQEVNASIESEDFSPIVLYCGLVAYFFPELLEWAEEHPVKGELPLDLWDEFHRKVSDLIGKKEPLIQAWVETTKQKINNLMGDLSKGANSDQRAY